jgi:hypothetical protein
MRTLRLTLFPPFAGQRDVAHVRPSFMLALHLKLLISFSDRDNCANFARAMKDALVEKTILKYHYSAQLLAPVDDPSGTVMYSIKVSRRSQQAPSAESSVSTIQRRSCFAGHPRPQASRKVLERSCEEREARPRALGRQGHKAGAIHRGHLLTRSHSQVTGGARVSVGWDGPCRRHCYVASRFVGRHGSRL